MPGIRAKRINVPTPLGHILAAQHLAYGGGVYGMPAPRWGGNPSPPMALPPGGGGRSFAPVGLGGQPGGSPGMGILNTTPTGSQSFNNVPFQSGFQATAPQSTLGFNPGQFQPGIGQAQNTLGSLGNILLAQANGGGPNPAALQEKQATDRNIAQTYAMAQSNPNNPATARNVVNQAAELNQEAAGQSAAQTAAQQLAAEQQLQGLGLGELGTSGALMTDQEKLALEQNQGNQNATLTAQGQNLQQTLANQGIASGLLNQAIAAGAGAAGGIASGVVNAANGGGSSSGANEGSITGATSGPNGYDTSAQQGIAGIGGDSYYQSQPTYAHGGLVAALHARRYAAGGPVAMTDPANPADYDYDIGSQVQDPRDPVVFNPSLGAGAGIGAALATRGMGGGSTTGGQLANGAYSVMQAAAPIPVAGPILAGMGTLGKVVQAAAPDGIAGGNGSVTTNPDGTKTINNPTNIFDPGTWFMRGGQVPGRAQVSGDSSRNDTVPAVLSPGEIILPRSVTESNDSPQKAKAFVEAIRLEHGKKKSPQSYGELLQEVRRIHARLDQLGRGAA